MEIATYLKRHNNILKGFEIINNNITKNYSILITNISPRIMENPLKKQSV
jgi:hypothetical protein